MHKSIKLLLIIFVLISSCNRNDDSVISAFDIYCEMVANNAKPVALHYPMESKEIDKLWNDFQLISEKYQVQLYREDNFPSSMLFPAELTAGKEVVLIYTGNRLKQYQQWKADVLDSDRSDLKEQEALARRFGRLLGYSPQGINQLLASNSDYRNLAMFNVQSQVTHLYYDDLDEAKDFYRNTLGLVSINTAKFKIGADSFIELHSFNDDHYKGQPKSTAIALLTDHLAEWYEYVNEKYILIKYTYKPRHGGPHDGFVAIDPGGYLLEFEQFKQHPENELFMAILEKSPRVETTIDQLNFYGSITWTYHKDLQKMQKFYEEVLGYRMVADQGWTKIYQTSPTGFTGLVDECRGMEDYADTKAVEIEWKTSNLDLLDTYAKQFWKQYNYNNKNFVGPDNYIYRVN